MLQIEEDVDGPLAPPDRHRLAVQHGGERGQALLTIEQQLPTGERVRVLGDREVARRHWLVRLPHQDRAARIAAVERVQQVAYPCRSPDVVPLNLGQAHLAALVHVHQRADRNVLLLHGGQSPRYTWSALMASLR